MAGEKAGMPAKESVSKPAWRMRVAFERKIMAAYRDTYRGDFGAAQIEALEELYQAGALRQQDLAAALRISKQHASKIVGRLEGLGYARLDPDMQDNRCHRVSLTEAGRAFVDRHIEEGEEHVEALLGKLSAAERAELEQAMDTVARILEKV